MAENTRKLVAVPIAQFRRATRDITFDVYLSLSDENYAHVFSRTTGLDYKRLAQYIQKGVEELFVREEDLGAYENFISRTADSVFKDPSTPTEKKIATLINMTEQNMAEIFTQLNVPEETATTTQRVVNNYVSLLTSDPRSLAIILNLVCHGDYLYYHSIAVSIFSMFIAKASGQFNQKTIETIGLGGFLHDIGATQLPKNVADSPTDLSAEQWSLMRTHPKLGLQMVEGTSKIPDEVRHIIYQHHEEPSGHGYPNGLLNSAIYYPAKVVAIADGFSALISNRPFRPAYPVNEAIRILQSGRGKHDPNLVDLLAKIFQKQVPDTQGPKKAA